jgi:hypothetical protein
VDIYQIFSGYSVFKIYQAVKKKVFSAFNFQEQFSCSFHLMTEKWFFNNNKASTIALLFRKNHFHPQGFLFPSHRESFEKHEQFLNLQYPYLPLSHL